MMDRLLGWFPHNHREWIEFIIVALLLWLLMVVAISELDLSSISEHRLPSFPTYAAKRDGGRHAGC